MTDDGEITGLLAGWGNGDAKAGEALTPLVYEELHRCAARLFRGENAGHTLQPTALVHEAYEKLINVEVTWRDRAHFFALAARMMRRLLINHANASRAAKRGGDAMRVTLLETNLPAGDSDEAVLLELTDAITDLESHDSRKAQLIELKYFGGMTTEEIEAVTGLSAATIGRDLRFARAWLKDRLTESG